MSQFEHAKRLHLAGDIDGAMAGYRQLIEEDPAHLAALNMLGNAFQDLGEFSEATKHYRRAIECNPQYFAAYYNLGNTQCQMDKLEEAITSYLKAIELNPEFAQAHFNLGNTLLDLDRNEDAISAFKNALKYDDEDYETHFNLGKALTASDQDEKAMDAFRRVLMLNSSSAQAGIEIGQIHLKLGHFESAFEEFRKATEADQHEGESHFNMAWTLVILNRHDEAEVSFRRALQIDPDHSRFLEGLGRLLLNLDRRAEALGLMDTWLEKEPDNPRAKHLRIAWGEGPPPVQAEVSYIRQEFDYFAEDFDATMKRQGYRGPQLVAEVLDKILKGEPASAIILDLGCGTGLCGSLLQPLASRLIGVDLSNKMLAKADRRDVYNIIVTAEATGFLMGHPEYCDAVVAADTFAYFGDLSKVFSAVNIALFKGGHFVFSAECLVDPDENECYRLNPSGRFSHDESYLRTMLETSGLIADSFERIDLRREGGVMIPGFLVVAHKPE